MKIIALIMILLTSIFAKDCGLLGNHEINTGHHKSLCFENDYLGITSEVMEIFPGRVNNNTKLILLPITKNTDARVNSFIKRDTEGLTSVYMREYEEAKGKRYEKKFGAINISREFSNRINISSSSFNWTNVIRTYDTTLYGNGRYNLSAHVDMITALVIAQKNLNASFQRNNKKVSANIKENAGIRFILAQNVLISMEDLLMYVGNDPELIALLISEPYRKSIIDSSPFGEKLSETIGSALKHMYKPDSLNVEVYNPDMQKLSDMLDKIKHERVQQLRKKYGH